MSSGFWAGAVPPWAWVVGGCLGVLLVLAGAWYGYGRGWKHAEEEARWAREQAKARRIHPVYRQPSIFRQAIDAGTAEVNRILFPEIAHDWDPDCRTPGCPVHGNMPADQPSDPITTGEIQAITDETDLMVARRKADNDLWMAEHGLSDT